MMSFGHRSVLEIVAYIGARVSRSPQIENPVVSPVFETDSAAGYYPRADEQGKSKGGKLLNRSAAIFVALPREVHVKVIHLTLASLSEPEPLPIDRRPPLGLSALLRCSGTMYSDQTYTTLYNWCLR